MGFVKYCWKVLPKMARVADGWEKVLLGGFPLFTLIVLMHGALGIPRLAAGGLLFLLILHAVACIVVLDNLHTRSEQFLR